MSPAPLGDDARQTQASPEASPGASPGASPCPRWRQWLVFAARRAVEACAVLLALVVIAGAGVMWRLSQGPMTLDVVRPQVEAAMAAAMAGDRARVGQIQAEWSVRGHRVVVSLRDVEIFDDQGETVMQAPQVIAGVDAGQLVLGRLAFSRLESTGGAFALVRQEDGRFIAGFGGVDRIAERASRAGDDPAPPQQGDEASFAAQAPAIVDRLTELRLTDVTLGYRDARLGVDLTVTDATMRFVRTPEGLLLEATGAAPMAGQGAAFSLTAETDDAFATFFAQLDIANVSPARILDVDGALGVLARLDAPLTLAAEGRVAEGGQLRSGRFDVLVEEGTILREDGDVGAFGGAQISTIYDPSRDRLTIADAQIAGDGVNGALSGVIDGVSRFGVDAPLAFALTAQALEIDTRGMLPAPMRVDQVTAKGVFLLDRRAVTFETLKVDLRQASATLAGMVQLETTADGRRLPSIRLSGDVDGVVTAADLLSFWPTNFVLGARDWVEAAVLQAEARAVSVMLDIPAQALADRALADEHLEIQFAFQNADVRMVSTMSPITGGRGQATLRGNSLELGLDEGQMRGMALTKGYVRIPLLTPKGQPAYFGAVANGPVVNALSVVDEPPLQFLSKYGVRPDDFGGAGAIKVDITRPMLRHVPPEDMDFSITADITDASGPSAFPGLPLSDAKVDLTVTPGLISTAIDGYLGPAEASVVWTEDLSGDAALPSSLDITALVDSTVLDAMGLPSRTMLTGAIPVRVSTRGVGFAIREADISADLTPVGLRLPQLNWRKPAGVPGEARIVIKTDASGVMRFEQVRFAAEDDLVQGAFSLNADRALEALTLAPVRLDAVIDAQIEMSRNDAQALIVRVDGAYLDGRLVLPTLVKPPPDDEPVGPALDLQAAFEQVRITDADTVTDVSVSFAHTGERVDSLAVEAFSGEQPLSFLLYPEEDDGWRRMRLRAPDGGMLLQALYQIDALRGGVVELDGRLPPVPPRSRAREGDSDTNREDDPRALADPPVGLFELRLRDFQLVDPPILARILSLASIKGFSDTVSGDGIAFTRFVAPGTLGDGVITLDEAVLAGPSIGMSLNGDIDLANSVLDLEGVLAPAYALNSAVGGIPLVGDLLVSRDGEGVFGVTFSVRGPMDETRITVNPLSALAPGILRRIFQPPRDDGVSREDYDAVVSPTG